MGGVFMKKYLGRILICCLTATLFWGGALIADRQKLKHGIIRFHVVANSDSREDQAIKLKVRDAVLNSMEADLRQIADIEEAREYLQQNLPKIRLIADETLKQLGCSELSQISLCKEAFDIRHYDTFTLPAGVYESLRIVIGEGLGQNWWCVSFPALCIPATADGFADAAVSAGFSQPLVKSLSHSEDYEIHFYLLDKLGELETALFRK